MKRRWNAVVENSSCLFDQKSLLGTSSTWPIKCFGCCSLKVRESRTLKNTRVRHTDLEKSLRFIKPWFHMILFNFHWICLISVNIVNTTVLDFFFFAPESLPCMLPTIMEIKLCAVVLKPFHSTLLNIDSVFNMVLFYFPLIVVPFLCEPLSFDHNKADSDFSSRGIASICFQL